MVYVIYFFASLFLVLSAGMFFAYYRSRHFGLFIMGMTYAASGLLAFGLPHWWPLVTGFVLAWMLRMLGLEPDHAPQISDTGGETKDEAKGESDAVRK
jgi:hypothetical protein